MSVMPNANLKRQIDARPYAWPFDGQLNADNTA